MNRFVNSKHLLMSKKVFFSFCNTNITYISPLINYGNKISLIYSSGIHPEWNQAANVHLATTILSKKLWGIAFV